ncbi:hypothetical protein SPAN111604_14255 [Sphingomonas antarctica]|uniref:helix-turn-helix transcriptional regulator n=1 Tax=Sphingomonas antarctica TaxID=2040274 RepID=UPI0039EA0848
MLLHSFSTDMVAPELRTQLFADDVGRKLTTAEPSFIDAANPSVMLNWRSADFGDGAVIARGLIDGASVERTYRTLKDGDHDFTLFVATAGRSVEFEQNDFRARLPAGWGVLAAHGRRVRSIWREGQFELIRVPREALRSVRNLDALCGRAINLGDEHGQLLLGYLRLTWSIIDSGVTPPPIAMRHVGELLRGVVIRSDPLASDAPSRQIARYRLMCETIQKLSARPGLTMTDVALVVGVSRRTGYAIFEAMDADFGEILRAARLDRAAEVLRITSGKIEGIAWQCGIRDVSNFNRRFRERFGCSPNDYRTGKSTNV